MLPVRVTSAPGGKYILDLDGFRTVLERAHFLYDVQTQDRVDEWVMEQFANADEILDVLHRDYLIPF